MNRVSATMVALCVFSLVSPFAAGAQSAPPPDGGFEQLITPENAGSSLTVRSGEIRRIAPGSYLFKDLEIESGGVLQFVGSVSIMARRLSSGGTALVKYVGDPGHPDQVVNLTLNSLDASAVQGLAIRADGLDAIDYPTDKRAPDGAPGGDAKDPALFKTSGRSSDTGSPGSDGAPGATGGNAVNVDLTLPFMHPDTFVIVSAIGGSGGRGQNGGTGGKGGNDSTVHADADGGLGGSAGRGGNGGSAGKIHVFLVTNDDDNKAPIDSDSVMRTTQIRPIYAAGAGGQPGMPGAGGSPGRGRPELAHGRAKPGRTGSAGLAGEPGQGPKQSPDRFDQSWAVVDIMTARDYVAFFEQKAALLGQQDAKEIKVPQQSVPSTAGSK